MTEVQDKITVDPPALDPYDAGIPSKPNATDEVRLGKLARAVASQFHESSISPPMFGGFVRLSELAIVMATGFTTYGVMVGLPSITLFEYSAFIVSVSGLAVFFGSLLGAYAMGMLRRPFAAFDKVAVSFAAAFCLLILSTFMMKNSVFFSRAWFVVFSATSFAAVMAERLLLAKLLIRWSRNGRLERRAVIVGGGDTAKSLIRSIERSKLNDVRICGIFDDRDDDRSPPIVAGYPKLGDIDDLIAFARLARIDMLIVTIPVTAERRVLQMLKKLWVLPVDIRMAAHADPIRYRRRTYAFVGDVPTLPILDRPITDWDSVAKRLFDIGFSLGGILIFSPIMIATAIAIKLNSRGPVLFKQLRHGFNNDLIEVYKFRSMYTDMCDATAINAVTRDDPRVTAVGKFIRRTSIDELPQFFNVLLGNLSLVGPRPHAASAQTRNRLYAEVVDGYFARHRVKPGVTGWAQINGWRGEIDVDEKIQRRTEFDLYYIENWSLRFDLKILLLTPFRLFSKNAY